MEKKRKKLKLYHLYILFFILALIPLILFYYNSCGENKHSNISSARGGGGNGGNGGTRTTGAILSGEKTIEISAATTLGGEIITPKIDFLFIVDTSNATRQTNYIRGNTPKFTTSNFLSIPEQNIDWKIQVLRFGDLPSGSSAFHNNSKLLFSLQKGNFTVSRAKAKLTEIFLHLSDNPKFAKIRTISQIPLSTILSTTADISFRDDADLAVILISAIDDKPSYPDAIEALNIILTNEREPDGDGRIDLDYKFHSIVRKDIESCEMNHLPHGSEYLDYSRRKEGTTIDICGASRAYDDGFEAILTSHGATPVDPDAGPDQNTPATSRTVISLQHAAILGSIGIYKQERGEETRLSNNAEPSGTQVEIRPRLTPGDYKITYSYRSSNSPPPDTTTD